MRCVKFLLTIVLLENPEFRKTGTLHATGLVYPKSSIEAGPSNGLQPVSRSRLPEAFFRNSRKRLSPSRPGFVRMVDLYCAAVRLARATGMGRIAIKPDRPVFGRKDHWHAIVQGFYGVVSAGHNHGEGATPFHRIAP